MSYPTLIVANLLEIDGTSCGTAMGELQWVASASPPEYRETGSGDFVYARCWRNVLPGGGYSWRLQLRYLVGTVCGGNHEFMREVDADDPTGSYCRVVNGEKDCDAGKAGVVDND